MSKKYLDDLSELTKYIETMELIVKKKEIYLNSRQIATITKKDHKKVLEDIRDEEAKLKLTGDERFTHNINGEPIFRLSSYTNSQNKVQPMYILNRSGINQIMSRYSPYIRRLVNIRLEILDKMFQLNSEEEEVTLEKLSSLHFTMRPILYYIYDVYNGLKSSPDLTPELEDHIREEERRWSKIYHDEDAFIEWWDSLEQHYRDTGIAGRHI